MIRRQDFATDEELGKGRGVPGTGDWGTLGPAEMSLLMMSCIDASKESTREVIWSTYKLITIYQTMLETRNEVK